MDEPEQSLDAWASATLWSRIAEADCAKVQIVVATHSWYPILHPEAFNIIEAVPGFLEEVRSLIQ
jgi:predicted ATPase